VPDNEIWIWGKQWWASGYNLTGSGLVELKEGDTITIAVGTKVTWLNKDNSSHGIIAGEDPIEVEYEAAISVVLRYNDSFSYTWLDPGMFLCYKHKDSMAHIAVVVS
jgi:plastocyanin